MLMPVIFKAREFALQASCSTNLKALGNIYHAYALDYGGGIPPLIRGSSTYKDVNWYSLIGPYGKDVLAHDAYGTTNDSKLKCPKSGFGYNSYAQNGSLGLKDFWGATNDFPTKFSQITGPETVVLMGEDHTMMIGLRELTSGFGSLGVHYRVAPTPHFGEYTSQGPNWINGSANILFCDGHVEIQTKGNIWIRRENLKVER